MDRPEEDALRSSSNDIKLATRRRTDRNFDEDGFMDRREEDALRSSSNDTKPGRSSSARKQRSPSESVSKLVAKKTCSSKQKDANFPAVLELNPGGIESGRTSTVRVCCYSRCSLNGHDSPPLPPLRSFLKAKRSSTVQTQKTMKVKGISPFRKEKIDTGQTPIRRTCYGTEGTDFLKTHREITKDENESSDYDRARKSHLSGEEEEELDNFVNSLEYDEFDHETDQGGGHGESGLAKGETILSTDFSESVDSDVGFTTIVFESENSLTTDGEVEYSSEITEEDDNLINKFNIGELPHILDEDNEISRSNLHIGSSTDEHALIEVEGNSKAKWNTKSIQRTEKTEEIREFNPRPPRFLPLEPDDHGAETVDLRHQMMDERRNSEEWMVDYALQRTITRLSPARNKKVELLVEAFETIMPTPYNHSNTLQPCS